ncbi:MAG TPA: sugar phosphate isomerase/epimerase [Bryobacteraceae bacterium]|jgi:sugar phosphate isomerase/epimerase
MTSHTNDTLSRRELLRNAALGAAGLTLLPAAARAGHAPNPYRPFRMAIQSYTLRNFKLDEALAKTKALGLNFWEGWDGHLPVTDDPGQIAMYKQKLAANGITMPTYGVVGFSTDEADARKKFVFAKAMGIRTLSAYPSYDSLTLLDKLTEEFKINIGIHNHGPGDNLYDKIQKEVDALKGHSQRIGACIDTGHYLMSDERPETAAGTFGTRIYGVHMKDVKIGPGEQKSWTVLGKGTLDINVFLKELIKYGYPQRGVLSLEYEEHADDPIPYVEECLKTLRNSLDTINHFTLIGK